MIALLSIALSACNWSPNKSAEPMMSEKSKILYEKAEKKIADLEEKLKDYEDKWYDKFSAMEVALSKLQSNTNAVTSMLGGM